MTKAQPREGTDPIRFLSRNDARRAGIPMSRLLGKEFHRVFFNLYVPSTVLVTTEVRAGGALLLSPAGSYISRSTAAELWGGCVPEQPLTQLTHPAGTSRCQRRGIRSLDAGPGEQTTTLRGLPITTPEQTFLDLAESLNLVDLVVLGDSLVAAGRTTPERLVEAADGWTGKGVRIARRAARLVRTGVDSPMESRLRVLIVLAGLPEPVVNFIVRDEDGDWVMRFDLSYPDLRLVIEYDGRHHAENDRQWDRDIERRELLDRAGWRIVVVRSTDIFQVPERTLNRIRGAMRDCGAGPLPRRPNAEWRRYFPGRRAAA